MESKWSRRRVVGAGVGMAAAAPLAGLVQACGGAQNGTTAVAGTIDLVKRVPVSADEGLERLMAGNGRFVKDALRNEGQDSVRRVELAQGQSPFAVVLGCADSRVPPNIVFDEGLGDLFVVRVAGNTAENPLVLGSIEYAAAELGSVLVMVLGHSECGAVHAALEVVKHDAELPGAIGDVVGPILPAVQQALDESPDASEKELLEAAVHANVSRTVAALEESQPILSGLIGDGSLKVVGGEYELDTGKVELVEG
jgi:carbonic anhydrase